MKKIIDFFKSGFNTNDGYSVLTRVYEYRGKYEIGYILVKNYKMFWIPGYDRIDLFVDKQSLEKYLKKHSINLVD